MARYDAVSIKYLTYSAIIPYQWCIAFELTPLIQNGTNFPGLSPHFHPSRQGMTISSLGNFLRKLIEGPAFLLIVTSN